MMELLDKKEFASIDQTGNSQKSHQTHEMSSSSSTSTTSAMVTTFRLLPELDDMQREINDLELEQTRHEAAIAREGRKEAALIAVRKARQLAEEEHAASQRFRSGNNKGSSSSATSASSASASAAAHFNKTAEEIEEERLSALRSAASAQDAFCAEYEAAFSAAALRDLLAREESLMRETANVSDEMRRFAHFAELGAVATPVARAAIYHLWDVDAMHQPCRCAHCGVVLLLKKQYIGDQLVEVFCAKCTHQHHRDQLFSDNLDLQKFYLDRTFNRIDDAFLKELEAMEKDEEPNERRLVAVEEQLQRELIFETRFQQGPSAEARAIRKKLAARNYAEGLGVL